MALETFYTFSADTLKAEIVSGKFKHLRHFMFGSMGRHFESTTAQWVTTQNSVTGGPAFVWYNVTDSAAVPSIDPKTKDHSPFTQVHHLQPLFLFNLVFFVATVLVFFDVHVLWC
jgi:hypothetical protein